MASAPPLSYSLSDFLYFVHPGCHRQDHEDEEGVEAPTAAGRGPQPAVIKIQT